MEKGKFIVWGKDTTQQPNALIVGSADNAPGVSDVKNEWKSVYPDMQFQLVMPGKAVDESKWK